MIANVGDIRWPYVGPFFQAQPNGIPLRLSRGAVATSWAQAGAFGVPTSAQHSFDIPTMANIKPNTATKLPKTFSDVVQFSINNQGPVTSILKKLLQVCMCVSAGVQA